MGTGSTQDDQLENEWQLVEESDGFFRDGDVFMVEVKYYGNQWIRSNDKP